MASVVVGGWLAGLAGLLFSAPSSGGRECSRRCEVCAWNIKNTHNAEDAQGTERSATKRTESGQRAGVSPFDCAMYTRVFYVARTTADRRRRTASINERHPACGMLADVLFARKHNCSWLAVGIVRNAWQVVRLLYGKSGPLSHRTAPLQ